MPPVEKIIMYDAPECARKVTMLMDGKEISGGFLSIDNYFFNKEEDARYRSCTHKVCDCGEIMGKGRTICDKCSSKKVRERYFAMPFQEWDGKTYLTVQDDDVFFSDAESLEDYCEDHEIKASDLMLVICSPNKLWEVTSEYWQDIAPEEDDFLPKEVAEALAVLNEKISTAPVVSWGAGKFRTSYEYTPESLRDQGEGDERSVATK